MSIPAKAKTGAILAPLALAIMITGCNGAQGQDYATLTPANIVGVWSGEGGWMVIQNDGKAYGDPYLLSRGYSGPKIDLHNLSGYGSGSQLTWTMTRTPESTGYGGMSDISFTYVTATVSQGYTDPAGSHAFDLYGCLYGGQVHLESAPDPDSPCSGAGTAGDLARIGSPGTP